MRTTTVIIILVLAVGGCGSEPAPPPSAPPPSGPAPTAASPSGPGQGPAPSTASPPGTREPSGTGEPSGPGEPPGPGELPGGLPHGERTLTGVVERSAGCVLLRVGARRWELTGTPVDGSAAGTTVTVTGQVTDATGCAGEDVTRALIVRSVTPR
ncbi:hypothetical protein [Actinoplanes sp. NPDC049802]|uniref:hypothetical protein n=1 Tax=Actinoplanes sp. NPDC049802 TaxID=3154742 RepID=UPI00340949E9